VGEIEGQSRRKISHAVKKSTKSHKRKREETEKGGSDVEMKAQEDASISHHSKSKRQKQVKQLEKVEAATTRHENENEKVDKDEKTDMDVEKEDEIDVEMVGENEEEKGDNESISQPSKGKFLDPKANLKGKKKQKRKGGDKEYSTARGIDFVDVACVVNFDIPHSHRAYVHRVGRTARAGRGGIAVTFVVSSSSSNPRDQTQSQGKASDNHQKYQQQISGGSSSSNSKKGRITDEEKLWRKIERGQNRSVTSRSKCHCLLLSLSLRYPFHWLNRDNNVPDTHGHSNHNDHKHDRHIVDGINEGIDDRTEIKSATPAGGKVSNTSRD
jgi:hypothetical protein